MPITAARLQVDVGADTSDAEAGIKGFDRKLNSMTRDMTRTGLSLSASLTAPLVGIAAAALNSAGGFEQSMNILQQVVGATEADMASLTEQALALGATTVFSAGEAAEGMLELGKAGFSTEQIMAAIPGVMDLAAAAGVSLGEAASITAAAINAFGLEAAESSRVANLLAAAANASAADITDLAAGLKQAGFAFDLANQPIENLVASLAILTNVGLTGSDAGTALKNAFMRMMNPTQEALDVMRELNISFYDAQGNMKQLPAIIDMLNASMANLTPQQRDAALSTIFLSDGMKAMIPLMEAGGEGFADMVGQVTKAGAATEVANARMQGLRGGIEYLKGSVDSFLIGAAMPFLDTLGGLARGAGDALTAFGELPQPIMNASIAFAGVLAAAGPLILALAGLAGAFSFLISPIGLVITAVAGLAAAWVADIGGMQQITATVAGQVQQSFSTMLTSALALAGGIATAFANTSFPSLQTLWEQFKAGDFETLATTIRTTAFDLMVNLDTELNITGKANELKAQLVGVVNSLGAAIGDLDFSAAQANLNGLRDGVLNGLTSAIEGVDWGQGGATFAGMIDSLTASIESLDFSAINWTDVFKRAFLGPAGVALAGIQWVIGSESFAGLKTAVQGAISEIQWGDIGMSFVGLGAAIAGELGAIVTDMASDISTTIPKIDVDWGQIAINTVGLVNSVSEKISSINWLGVGESIGSGLFAAVTGTIGALNWVNEVGTTIRAQALGLAINIGTEIGTALRGINVFEALVGLENSIKGAFGAVIGGALGQIGQELSFAFDLPEVDWSEVMVAFSWEEWISPMDWNSFVNAFSWDEFVSSIEWASFVPSVSWGSFVPNLSWSSFVDGLSWGSFIPDISWGSFVPSLDWTRFIPFLNLGGGSSSSSSSSGSSGGAVGGAQPLEDYTGGTISSVRPQSDFAMASAAGGITINVNVASIANDIDIHSAALKLAREFQRNVR
jgi:TP901 family phage tail tape measure protein